MPKLADVLKHAKTPEKRTEPVWEGPCSNGPNGGVTQSLLGKFLCCRERFRLYVIEGLATTDTFNSRLEFGNMWHVCEEHHARLVSGPFNWDYLGEYCKTICRLYPMQQDQINHWYEVAKALFPRYVDHWSKHPDVKDRTPLLQEQVFDVPYKLPSGRVVRLRGKWDSVDLIGKGKSAGIFLQENKTKSAIDGQKIRRQLAFDLQTMMYLVSLNDYRPAGSASRKNGYIWVANQQFPIQGVRYNVVRRSAHKSVESMLKKVEDDRGAGRIDEWFARWKVEISATDIARFRRECLDPILEQLCCWYELVRDNDKPFDTYVGQREETAAIHWREPFGIYDPVREGGSSDLDEYLESGSTVGLRRVETLFSELE